MPSRMVKFGASPEGWVRWEAVPPPLLPGEQTSAVDKTAAALAEVKAQRLLALPELGPDQLGTNQ